MRHPHPPVRCWYASYPVSHMRDVRLASYTSLYSSSSVSSYLLSSTQQFCSSAPVSPLTGPTPRRTATKECPQQIKSSTAYRRIMCNMYPKLHGPLPIEPGLRESGAAVEPITATAPSTSSRSPGAPSRCRSAGDSNEYYRDYSWDGRASAPRTQSDPFPLALPRYSSPPMPVPGGRLSLDPTWLQTAGNYRLTQPGAELVHTHHATPGPSWNRGPYCPGDSRPEHAAPEPAQAPAPVLELEPEPDPAPMPEPEPEPEPDAEAHSTAASDSPSSSFSSLTHMHPREHDTGATPTVQLQQERAEREVRGITLQAGLLQAALVPLTDPDAMQAPVPPSGAPRAGSMRRSAKAARAKRKQVRNACTNCQRVAKKGCSDTRPCHRCVRLGIADTCQSSVHRHRLPGMRKRHAPPPSATYGGSNNGA